MTTTYKVIRQILNTKAALTNEHGDSTQVVFSLVQRQAIVDGAPGLRSTSGEIRFAGGQETHELWSAGKPLYLTGGGIEAKIVLETMGAFLVIGSIVDIK